MNPEEVRARGKAVTLPGRGVITPVPVRRPLPCFVILVHGVNDLGESYPQQEDGICQGLNERLDRGWDLKAAPYTVPGPKDALQADPDRVYYRRQPDASTFSPVIPFYWGYREHAKRTTIGTHGQKLDRYGNRLDADGAKEGGPFANATNSLPDLWAPGWNPYQGMADTFNGDPTHPLKGCPPRTYMVLAALRLAMVIKLIRRRHPKAAINLVCHSQGCLVSMLATNFLAEENIHPPDALILQSPPYSLQEPVVDDINQRSGAQQTSRARIETLARVANHLYQNRFQDPLMALYKHPEKGLGVAGPRWGEKPDPTHMGQVRPFPERDNRGKTYLYFSPDDGTVALRNHMGIGWQGVPDLVQVPSTLISAGFQLEALSRLGPGFKQRVFTDRIREGQPLPVGLPPGRIVLHQAGDHNPPGIATAGLKEGETRQITGEALQSPIPANIRTGDDRGRRLMGIGAIDAAIAVTACELRYFKETVEDPRPPNERIPLTRLRYYNLSAVEVEDEEAVKKLKPLILDRWNKQHVPAQEQNEQRIKAQSCWDIQSITMLRDGRIEIYRQETGDEARARLQKEGVMANTYHSGIPGYMPHHKYITAYDLALGLPIPWSQKECQFVAYLHEISDWRNPNARGERSDPTELKLRELNNTSKYGDFFTTEPDKSIKNIILETSNYHKNGLMPDIASIASSCIHESTNTTHKNHNHKLILSETQKDFVITERSQKLRLTTIIPK